MSRKPSQQANAAMGARQRQTDTARTNAETILAMGMLADIQSRWRLATQKLVSVQRVAGDRAAFFSSVTKGMRFLLQSAVLAFGAYLVIQGEMTGGLMIAASVITSRALAPVEQIVGQWRSFIAARQAYSRIAKILAGLPAEGRDTRLPLPNKQLIIKQLTSGPLGAKITPLMGITFELNAGEALGVLGPSGAGKSSFARAGMWFALTPAEVLATLKQCSTAFELKCYGIGLSPRKSADKRPAGEMSVTRYVPDPSIAKSEKIIQMATLDQKRCAAQVQVEVKMSTLIGGLSRIGSVRDQHRQAAARLKTLHEQAQLGGARAVDYSAVKVDTSGSGDNNIGEIGEQARRDYKIATDALGSSKAEIIERVVIFGETISQIAKGRGIGTGGAARAKVTAEVVDAVDDLARHFGLYAGAGRGQIRVKGWADGPGLPLDMTMSDPPRHDH